jgi:hypothetical protein
VVGLAMGILTQAVRDLIRPQKKLEKDWQTWQADSDKWFSSDEDAVGSFLWVCDVIETDPEGIRRWLGQLKKASQKEQKSIIQSLLRMTYFSGGSTRNRNKNNELVANLD